jgi:hypothetical protein
MMCCVLETTLGRELRVRVGREVKAKAGRELFKARPWAQVCPKYCLVCDLNMCQKINTTLNYAKLPNEIASKTNELSKYKIFRTLTFHMHLILVRQLKRQ